MLSPFSNLLVVFGHCVSSHAREGWSRGWRTGNKNRANIVSIGLQDVLGDFPGGSRPLNILLTFMNTWGQIHQS